MESATNDRKKDFSNNGSREKPHKKNENPKQKAILQRTVTNQNLTYSNSRDGVDPTNRQNDNQKKEKFAHQQPTHNTD